MREDLVEITHPTTGGRTRVKRVALNAHMKRGWQVAAEPQAHDDQDRSVVEQPAAPLDTPSPSASKADWVTFAVNAGMSAEEANQATRDELVDRFTA